MKVLASSRCNALLTMYAGVIWELVDREGADLDRVFVLLEEHEKGVSLMLDERGKLAQAMRLVNPEAAAAVALDELPEDTVMVFVAPYGNEPGAVVPLPRKGVKAQGEG